MRSPRPTILAVIVVAAMAASGSAALAQGGGTGPTPTTTTPTPPPPPPPKLRVEAPTRKTYVKEGQAGRYLLGGTWYVRQDDTFIGVLAHWYRQRSLFGWT